jgi:hypothetical protein
MNQSFISDLFTVAGVTGRIEINTTHHCSGVIDGLITRRVET